MISQKMKGIIGLVVKAALLRVINHDWKLMVVTVVASMLFVTYLATSLQSILAMRSFSSRGKRPPVVPYWMPYVGSTISYFWDGPRLAAKIVYAQLCFFETFAI